MVCYGSFIKLNTDFMFFLENGLNQEEYQLKKCQVKLAKLKRKVEDENEGKNKRLTLRSRERKTLYL